MDANVESSRARKHERVKELISLSKHASVCLSRPSAEPCWFCVHISCVVSITKLPQEGAQSVCRLQESFRGLDLYCLQNVDLYAQFGLAPFALRRI